MSYSLEFTAVVFDVPDDFGKSSAKRLRQVFLKILSLRRLPRPPNSEQLSHLAYKGLAGFRVTQGEYRILYAVDEKAGVVNLARVFQRDRDHREFDHI